MLHRIASACYVGSVGAVSSYSSSAFFAGCTYVIYLLGRNAEMRNRMHSKCMSLWHRFEAARSSVLADR